MNCDKAFSYAVSICYSLYFANSMCFAKRNSDA